MILIAIGSNLLSNKFGKPINNCLEAVKALSTFFKINEISCWYESEPVPSADQPWYVNGIISISSNYEPKKIMNILLKIESEFGRVRIKKNEARTIDLDLICYNELVIKTGFLTLPHPRMHLRAFVLKPLLDLSPDWVHPIYKMSAKELFSMIHKEQNIKRI
tara:strand:- start:5 stop:490 length:486 start_codon:yes stop_codon:yes gene_type:complete